MYNTFSTLKTFRLKMFQSDKVMTPVNLTVIFVPKYRIASVVAYSRHRYLVQNPNIVIISASPLYLFFVTQLIEEGKESWSITNYF